MEDIKLPIVSNPPVVQAPQTQPSGTDSVNNQTGTPAKVDGNGVTSPTPVSGTQDVTSQYTPPSENEYKSLTGKVSSLEKRAVEAEKTRYGDYAKMLNSDSGIAYLNDRFAQDRESFNWFREQHRKATGQDLGAWEQLYGQTQQTQQGSAPSYNPQDIDKVVEGKVSQTLERQRAFDDFLASRQQQFGELYGSENGGETLVRKIVKLAMAMQDEYPNMTFAQRMTHAFDSLPEVVEKRISQAKSDGQVIGQAGAYASQVGVQSSIQGSTSKPAATNDIVGQLNSWQKERYDYFAKTKGVEWAQSWAKNAVSRNR